MTIMNRPTLRQLEYLSAIADTLSFRQAAEACHVSQPALSTQIQQLERLLGTRLFERDRRSVLPTEAGERAAERARHILAAVDELIAAAQAHREPLSGTLKLGVIPTIAPFLLPRALPRVRARYPALRLWIREEPTARLLQALAAGSMDVLLLALETELGSVRTHPLFEDPFLLAVPPGHRLAGRKRVREADLFDESVLLLEDGH